MPIGARSALSILLVAGLLFSALPAWAISQAEAVRIVRSCTNGGEVLSPGRPAGDGFVFKVLVGSQVRMVKVNGQGQCG